MRPRPCLCFLKSYLLVVVGCRSQLSGVCYIAQVHGCVHHATEVHEGDSAEAREP